MVKIVRSKRYSSLLYILAAVILLQIVLGACLGVFSPEPVSLVRSSASGERSAAYGLHCDAGSAASVRQPLSFLTPSVPEEITFSVATYGAESASAQFLVSLRSDTDDLLWESELYLEEIADNSDHSILPELPSSVSMRSCTLCIDILQTDTDILIWGRPEAGAIGQSGAIANGAQTGWYLDLRIASASASGFGAVYAALCAIILIAVCGIWTLTRDISLGLRIALLAALSLAAGFVCTVMYDIIAEGEPLSMLGSWIGSLRRIDRRITFDRMLVLTILAFIAFSTFMREVRAQYDRLWSLRYAIAAGLLLVLVLLQVHGSSIDMYDSYLGSDTSAFGEPIFNEPRGIRSDEWANATASRIAKAAEGDSVFSTEFDAPVISNSLRACSMTYVGWGALNDPFHFLYLLLGAEYGESLVWCGTLIGSFMAVLEWIYVMTGKKRAPALAGACTVVFSGFFQWWSMNPKWIYLLCGILAMLWYFFEYKKFWQKALLIFGIATLGADFICYMYVPWIIPSGYVFLALAVWILVQKRKELCSLKKKEVLLIAAGVLYALSIVAVSLYLGRDYFASVTQTAYPGARRYAGGGFRDYLLGASHIQLLAHELFFAPNPCENSGMLTLFPLPLIAAAAGAVWRLIKRRRQNALQLILIFFSLLYFVVVSFDMPQWFMNVTLLFYTTGPRLTSVFMWLQVLLLFSVLADEELTRRRPVLLSALCAAALAYCSYRWLVPYVRFASVPIDHAPIFVWGGLILLAGSLGYLFVRGTKFAKTALCIAVSLQCLVTAAPIHPVMRTLDCVYERPIAHAISDIAEQDPDAVWITSDTNFTVGNYLRMCGANSICGSQQITNNEYWQQIDPTCQYEGEYNRWAYLWMELTTSETYFVGNADTVVVHLNTDDLDTLNIKYVHAIVPKPILEELGWTTVYSGSGGIIYKNPAL